MATSTKSAVQPKQSQLFQPDTAHLAYLTNDAEIRYETNVSNTRCEYRKGFFPGALERFSASTLDQTFALYAAKIAEGYTPSLVASEYTASSGGVFCAFTLTKPESVRTQELKAVIAKARQDYLEDLEQQRADEIERQVELRFATEQRAAEQARIEKEKQDKQRLRDEVMSALGVK
jgi:hypothetical protein